MADQNILLQSEIRSRTIAEMVHTRHLYAHIRHYHTDVGQPQQQLTQVHTNPSVGQPQQQLTHSTYYACANATKGHEEQESI